PMSPQKALPKRLIVDAAIVKNGIDVIVNGDHFPIIYPSAIWSKTPAYLKEILKDNLAYSSTLFVPQILNIRSIEYKTARPISETYLYKCGIYDMACSAHTDGKSSQEYVNRFVNTRVTFADETIKVPPTVAFDKKPTDNALITFSFGKESLLSYALASRELGLHPILVNAIEPVHTYENDHKQILKKQFEKEMNIKPNFISFGPGIFKYGKYWGLETELGTGLWVTEYLMMSLPFIHYFDASYAIVGNEQSCNDDFYDREGMLTFRYAYDQIREWTTQLSLLTSMLCGRRIEVMSLVEPLNEIAETNILHRRYPDIGKYQMSCFAMDPGARDRRWCQNCDKCSYMFPMLASFGIDPYTMGFTDSLFDKKYEHLYKGMFTGEDKNEEYGGHEETMVSFYLAMKNGYTGANIDRFKKVVLPKFNKKKKYYITKYMGVHETQNIPPRFKNKIMSMYRRELKSYL
ncbi:hypothetical protein HYS00_01350, partial [Candidatus Microgenomates bacterium]|nr:hypothetical protein [Candidatus Microgenomates bacterium]